MSVVLLLAGVVLTAFLVWPEIRPQLPWLQQSAPATSTPAVGGTSEPSSSSGVAHSPACPSPAQAAAAVGVTADHLFDTDTKEPCGWRWRGANQRLECPAHWSCVIALESTAALYYGDFAVSGTVAVDGVAGATIRYVPAYPDYDHLHDPCLQLANEQAWTGVPGYPSAGNFKCPGAPRVP